MLGWFTGHENPNQGPDYSHIDSCVKAENLYRRGELKKLLLLPAEFGGKDIPVNVVYVPAFAVDLKTRMDLNVIKPLVQKGTIRRYNATPEYEGKSFIPALIRISATDPGHFEETIAIWGKAAQKSTNPVPEDEAVDQTAFTPASESVEALGPEEFVRAFIADYESWNRFAWHQLSLGFSKGAVEAAESAYEALIRNFCPPGLKHQPITCSSDSSHDIAREAIVSAEIAVDSCVVKTRLTKTLGKTTLANDHEYHLKKMGHRWFLTSILHLVGNRKLEVL